MSKSTQADFRAIRAKYAARNANFAIYAVKKNGDLYARPHSYTATQEDAQRKVDTMTELNPGSTFVVQSAR